MPTSNSKSSAVESQIILRESHNEADLEAEK